MDEAIESGTTRFRFRQILEGDNMGQQTGTTAEACDGWDNPPYSIDLQENGTTQAFVYHSLTQPSSDEITAFI